MGRKLPIELSVSAKFSVDSPPKAAVELESDKGSARETLHKLPEIVDTVVDSLVRRHKKQE